MEREGAVGPQEHALAFATDELRWIDGDRVRATMLFVAKEAAFKAVARTLGRGADLTSARVRARVSARVSAPSASASTFDAVFPGLPAICGRWARTGGFVLAAVAISSDREAGRT